jgi:hypothetical protein
MQMPCLPTLTMITKLASRLGLYRLPKVIRIEEFRELRIDVYDMNISLLGVSDDGFVVVSCLVRLDINPQGSVDLELQTFLLVSKSSLLDCLFKKSYMVASSASLSLLA